MIPTGSLLLAALSPYQQSDVLTAATVTFGFMDAGNTFDAGDVDGARPDGVETPSVRPG